MSLKIESIIANGSEIFRSWVNKYGENKYQDLIFYAESIGITDFGAEILSELAKYEYNLELVVFEIIGHIENYLRACICRNYRLDNINNKEMLINILIDNELSVIARNKKKSIKNCYDYINYCKFSYLQSIFLKAFSNHSFCLQKHNFLAINELRNAVCHHRVLLHTYLCNCKNNFKSGSDLTSNIMNVINFLPDQRLQQKYVEEINNLSFKYDKKLSTEELTIKLNYNDLSFYLKDAI